MPRKVMVSRRQADGTMGPEHEEDWPTEKETYEGRERLAIIDALNVLGRWMSPLAEVKRGCDFLAEDYEWGEAYMILYGALGIDLNLSDPNPGYEEYVKIRTAEWDKTP